MKRLHILPIIIATLFLMCSASIPAFSQEVMLDKYSMGDGLIFTDRDNDYSIGISGFVQPYFESRIFTDPNIEDAAQRFRMRRIRLRLNGTAAQDRIIWRLQGEFSGNLEGDASTTRYLTDAWVGYRIGQRWQVRVGQKNTPTDNRELLIRSNALQMVERSRVTSAFSTIREFGLFVDGTIPFGNGMYVRPSVAITNGDGPNVFQADFGGLKYGGRLDFLPFGLFTNMGQYYEVDMMRELVPRLVIGAAYSFNEGMSSRRGRESGAILYLNDQNQYSLPDYAKLCIDFMFKYKGFSAVGEFVSTTASVPDDISQRIREDGSITGSFLVDGEQDVENYVKNRMMLGSGFNIQMGYLFKCRFSVDLRYTHLEADEYSFLNNGTFYNRPNNYTLAITQYIAKNYGAKISASVTFVEALSGSNYINGDPMNGNELIFRLITSIAF